MRIPDNYPQQLSDILDVHMSCELLPSRYCVNFLNIKEEFNRFFAELKLNRARIADFFGRSLPYGDNAAIAAIESFECRKNFKDAAKKLYGNKVKPLDINNLELDNYDLILINLEFGGLSDHGMPLWLNEKFRKHHKVFGYKYNLPHQAKPEGSLFYRSDDNEEINTLAEFNWYKHMVSHVHQGVKRIEREYLTLFDLNINY
ncbi:hypothetical protein [Thalassomonas sp. RHCl1]|uniref:hypothetical protein n=1 Tax=Thalassomonas sp. RHCl1 TaxID=2995320 RepID=UPI00248CC83F|nr:hypothetical protein [Thalassomonas sp. RHCl1]